jgi:hypothetical protein
MLEGSRRKDKSSVRKPENIKKEELRKQEQVQET